jgi:hypothetical protein
MNNPGLVWGYFLPITSGSAWVQFGFSFCVKSSLHDFQPPKITILLNTG